MVIGVIICSLGVSMYQRPDVGVSPYDSLSLIMDEKLPKISYFWCRMSNDVICALVAYFAGGLVGIGTVIAAFGLGPIVHFFNIHVTDKLMKTENTYQKQRYVLFFLREQSQSPCLHETLATAAIT